jgi:hypothetical protein
LISDAHFIEGSPSCKNDSLTEEEKKVNSLKSLILVLCELTYLKNLTRNDTLLQVFQDFKIQKKSFYVH